MAQIINGGPIDNTGSLNSVVATGQHRRNGSLRAFPSEAYLSHYHHYHSTAAHYHYGNGINGDPLATVQNDNHVTVVQIDQLKQQINKHQYNGTVASDFVTVLEIVSSVNGTVMTSTEVNGQQQHHHQQSMTVQPTPAITTPVVSATQATLLVDSKRGEIEEEVTIYRLPGERLGMALRFDGGQSANECIRRVFVQNISPNSPASKAIGLMLGILREGDQILKIDSRLSSTLTRLDCITLLRDAPVCIRLLVKRITSPPPASNGGQFCTATNYVPNQPMTTSQTNGYHNGVEKYHSNPVNPYDHHHHHHQQQYHQPEQPVPKKVPPPVPPRMASTTLTTKRKPKPIPAIPVQYMTPVEVIEPQPVPVEKPPRRKSLNYHNNPPPLPPRRPKGPPPKPPVDRLAASVASVATSVCSKSLPTLVTVINTKAPTSSGDSPSKQSNTTITSSLITSSSITPSTSSHTIPYTTKVSFNISNSKVSSFIRQTAERLHRKLSGKSSTNEEEPGVEEDESPLSTEVESSAAAAVAAVVVSGDESKSKQINPPSLPRCDRTPIEPRTQSELQSMAPAPAVYLDLCPDNEDNSIIESDTDDTSSSVSTIIERGSLANSSFNGSIASHFAADTNSVAYFALPTTADEVFDNANDIVDRVLSPATSELNNNHDGGPLSLITLAKQSIGKVKQLSPNKSLKLISDDLLKEDQSGCSQSAKSPTCQSTLSGIQPVDTEPRRDDYRADEIQSNYFKVEQQATGDEKENKDPDEEDEEDFDRIKNDIISRVDDDKDDFMLDTDYLNESSSRFLYHHSGSELILAPYSELTSITEEDEEDDSEHNNASAAKCATIANDKVELNLNTNPFRLIDDVVNQESKVNVLSAGDMVETKEVKANEMITTTRADSADCDSDSSTDSQKINLNNVFEFLNEANDDFEFVERMLELTNDKIDSIDDIMRIRESIRGLQQSEKRENLEKFLDGKDVIDELMALSSSSSASSNSSASENECHPFEDRFEVKPKTKSHGPKSLSIVAIDELPADDYTSLPVFYNNNNSRIPKHNTGNNQSKYCESRLDSRIKILSTSSSKIPTLASSKPAVNSNNHSGLPKRSVSISNIYNRTTSLESRPSLIPRPISNFNLALPPKPTTTGLNSSKRSASHSCLNRSSSMQSIFHTNSLSRPRPSSSSKPLRRPLAQPLTSSSYHHNCFGQQQPLQYGSLSRSISKSSNNVYFTGSLPRNNKPKATPPPVSNSGIPQGIPHYNHNLRTASLVDLTYGLINGKQLRTSGSGLQQPQQQQQTPTQQQSLRLHSSSGNLCDSLAKEDYYHHQHQQQARKQRPIKVGPLRTSTSLISLNANPVGSSSSSSSHFWHCSHHTPINNNKIASVKRNSSSGSLTPKSRCLNQEKPARLVQRKLSKPSSTSSSSSAQSDDSPVPRSILRHSSGKKSWTVNRAKPEYELSSDSESSSDITISSRESAEYSPPPPSAHKEQSIKTANWQQPVKRRASHKVCFVDEIIEHSSSSGSSSDNNQATCIDYEQSIKAGKTLENSDNSSSYYLPEMALSSSASTSSISSLGSSGESTSGGKISSTTTTTTAKSCNQSNSKQLHTSQNKMSNKPYYLQPPTQREDSGIFASDDTSGTSEFSQSPSPELLMDKIDGKEVLEPIKDRIEFFDPVTLKSSNGTSTGHVLSRSASAPYESHCDFEVKLAEYSSEHLLLTPPQSPPNECAKVEEKPVEKQLFQEPQIHTTATVFPVTIKSGFGMKKSSHFSLQDEFITARRQQNLCKLKGLIIPESVDDNDDQVDKKEEAILTPEIDLPAIISEDMVRIDNLPGLAVESSHEPSEPIETIPLKPAQINVQKYSPTFKRRPFLTAISLDESKSSPPIPPPKPRMSLRKSNLDQVQDFEKVPPLPPKRRINSNVVVEEKVAQVIPPVEVPPTKAEAINENAIVVDLDAPLDKCFESSRSNYISNDFVIYQKQYSMRAIVYELSRAESDQSDIGIRLTGGLDSLNKEVTVEDIVADSFVQQDGRLQKGDRIISINGKILLGLTHEETVEQLKSAITSRKVMLVFSRPHDQEESEPNWSSMPISPSILTSMSFTPSLATSASTLSQSDSSNYKTIKADITKDVTGLGFIIDGGKNSSYGDRPITIKRIFRGGPVDKEGNLLEGDELLSVNDQSMQDLTKLEAWNFLKHLPDGIVSLVVRRKRYF